uniref:Myelin basic protein n=1 Tax=Myotis myotis TaxID=51298 RepID=A0A7J7VYZ6_MYOMY|nr:myelin basic protein [Myotis myotis]
MASQKRPSQRHGSKYLASASTMDHAKHAFLPKHRDTGFFDSLGRFFGGDRGVPKRGSGKDRPWPDAEPDSCLRILSWLLNNPALGF